MKFLLTIFSILSVSTLSYANNHIARNSFFKQWGPAIREINSQQQNTTKDKPIQTNRDKEKEICLANNIGIGNTFVWASRLSNLDNYSTMVEDVNNPENNACFVKIDFKSSNSKIKFEKSTKYFEMGQQVTCGSWVNEEKLKEAILDSKKTARILGITGSVIGGAGLGVGAMELFGNKMIGGAVEGQKSLSNDELIKSQLLALKKDNPKEFEEIYRMINDIVTNCQTLKNNNLIEIPQECVEIESIHSIITSI